MFEITHSGSWPAVVRPIVERVNAWYAVLFLTYITLVVFAVIRIVTALFLKDFKGHCRSTPGPIVGVNSQ